VEASSDGHLRPIEAYAGYLRVLARARLPGLVRRQMDTSDIVQTTLLEAHRAAPSFQGTTPAQQMAWLRRILTHNLADAVRDLRRARRDVARERPVAELLDRSSARLEHFAARQTSSLGERVARQETLLAISDAIAALPEEQQEAVVLRHVVGCGIREIAELMGRSESAVTALVHRGLVAVRERLVAGGEG
jgi:RNA polymerase sigma-70 factor (ECF subfamily)